jgi:anti-sigma factor RsiW
MEECPYIAMASAYQDGELIEPRLTEFQRHLVGCAPCAQRLTELRNFSIGLAQSAIPAMSADAIARLHEAVESALDRGLLRIAWALSGVAAAILLSAALGERFGVERRRRLRRRRLRRRRIGCRSVRY